MSCQNLSHGSVSIVLGLFKKKLDKKGWCSARMVSGRLPWISLYVRQCILYISCNTTLKHQWRIQDFLKEVPTPGKCVCVKISINKFSKIFAENCMIMTEFEPKRRVPITPVPLIVTEQWTKTIIWSYPPSWISNRWLINNILGKMIRSKERKLFSFRESI